MSVSHEYATLEHLLLALIDDKDAAAVMGACNVDLDALRKTVAITSTTSCQPRRRLRRGIQADGRLPARHPARRDPRPIVGRDEVTGANVLVAIFAERDSHAAYFLQEQDMTRYDAVNYISHGIAKRRACRSPSAASKQCW
jgi:ATP-dependent Clp protease ATP-binding subunit ClpA